MIIHPSAARVARVRQAASGDDLLTALAASSDRPGLLAGQATGVLRQALALCGEDARGLSRAALVAGILSSF